jgi:hypothetical protein
MIDSARKFFEALAARGREPRLGDARGTWEFDVQGVGTWTVSADQGALRVREGPEGSGKPTTRLHLREDELLRVARGDGHENLFTAVLRGALSLEGELAFAQRLQTILPIPEDWNWRMSS